MWVYQSVIYVLIYSFNHNIYQIDNLDSFYIGDVTSNTTQTIPKHFGALIDGHKVKTLRNLKGIYLEKQADRKMKGNLTLIELFQNALYIIPYFQPVWI